MRIHPNISLQTPINPRNIDELREEVRATVVTATPNAAIDKKMQKGMSRGGGDMGWDKPFIETTGHPEK